MDACYRPSKEQSPHSHNAGFIDPICARYRTKFFYNNELKLVSRSTQSQIVLAIIVL